MNYYLVRKKQSNHLLNHYLHNCETHCYNLPTHNKQLYYLLLQCTHTITIFSFIKVSLPKRNTFSFIFIHSFIWKMWDTVYKYVARRLGHLPDSIGWNGWWFVGALNKDVIVVFLEPYISLAKRRILKGFLANSCESR